MAKLVDPEDPRQRDANPPARNAQENRVSLPGVLFWIPVWFHQWRTRTQRLTDRPARTGYSGWTITPPQGATMPQSPGEVATASGRPVAPIPPQQLGDLFARSLALAGLIGFSFGLILMLGLVAWVAVRLNRIEGKIDELHPRPPERPD